MIPQYIVDIAARLTVGTNSENMDELSKDMEFGIVAASRLHGLKGRDVDWLRFLARLTLAVVSRAPQTERTDSLILLLTLYLDGEPVDDALAAAFADPELAATSVPLGPGELDLVRADFLRLLDELTTPHVTTPHVTEQNETNT